jgi:hypothetical protein
MKKIVYGFLVIFFISCGISEDEKTKVAIEIQKYVMDYDVAVKSVDVKKESGDYVGTAVLTYNENDVSHDIPVQFKASPFLFDTLMIDMDKSQLEALRPDAWKKKDESSMARVLIKDEIKKQLKSPSSAKFPGIIEETEYVIQGDDQMYIMRSWVDSQNSFGAMVRTEYTAVIQQAEQGKWVLHALNFNQ